VRRLRIVALVALAVTLIAVPAALALKIQPTPPPTGFVGVPYSFTFLPETGQGCTPYEWKFLVGALPPGLSIRKDDGLLSGTPTKAGTYTFYVELKSCAGNTTQRQFTMSIEEKLTVTTPGLPDGQINQPYGPVQLTASGGTVQTWSIQSGAFAPGITLSPNGVVSGTPTATGVFEALVLATGGSGKTDTKRLRMTVNGPLVLGGPDGTPPKAEPLARTYKIGAKVDWAIKATGGIAPYTYASTPLPAGIVLGADGKVTGTTTQAGLTLVTFKVTDAKGAIDELQARFKIRALLAFASTAVPPRGTVDEQYEWTVPVTGPGKTRTFLASGTFPPGLSLDETTGVLSGTPLAPGAYRIKIWVLGDPGTVISKTFTIRISP
jgi:hypothetical protein